MCISLFVKPESESLNTELHVNVIKANAEGVEFFMNSLEGRPAYSTKSYLTLDEVFVYTHYLSHLKHL